MDKNNLPLNYETLSLTYFPTAFQAVIFRLWESVPCGKIAAVLRTSEANIQKAAFQMGLDSQKHLEKWQSRGYISIIRALWNLIPDEQIMEILDYDEERFNFILTEEDFLRIKLGEKLHCNPVYYRELTKDELLRTEKIKAAVEKYIKPLTEKGFEEPFDFFNKDRYKPICQGQVGKVKVDSSWALEYPLGNELLGEIIADFKEFALSYGIEFCDTNGGRCKCGGKGKLLITMDAKSDDEEYHEVSIEEYSIKINAATPIGVLRGIYELENRVELAGEFSFDKMNIKRKTKVKTRYIYSFCSLYVDALDCDTRISFPDEQLAGYGRRGINGIWIQGILYKLTPYPFASGIDEGWEKRLLNLAELCKRALRYGIKIYLYINEPRQMPLEIFENQSALMGMQVNKNDKTACLCSSNEKVQKYLHDSIYKICSMAKVGGFVVITQSENLTTCYSRGLRSNPYRICPICSKRNGAVVTAELLSAIAKGASDYSDEIRVFAYAWCWIAHFGDELQALLELLPKNVSILEVSESQMPFEIGGVKGNVEDYSLSIVGPGEPAKKLWRDAKKAGLGAAAKVQFNTSWECSTAPSLPVYDNVVKHMENLIEEGTQHIQLSWTHGGYMSDNLKIASAYYFEASEESEAGEKDTAYDRIMKASYGQWADTVKKATSLFCKGFSEYPFSVQNMYLGPTNAGVANPFYKKPTGMKATMTCYPYDDIESWAKGGAVEYDYEVFANQYKKLCDKWKEGLEIIKDMPLCEFKDMAYFGYTLFAGSYNQIRYILERDGKARREVMDEIVKSELELTRLALEIALRNSAVGFEAANHYYFTRSALFEKIVQCDYLLNE